MMTISTPYRTLLLPLLFLLTVCAGCSTTAKSAAPSPAATIEEGLRLSQQRNYESAIEHFRAFIENNPLSRHAVDAQIHLADTLYEKGDYEDGAAYYTDFVTLHPAHPKAPYALFKKGMCSLKESLSIDRDPTATKKAILAFDSLTASYPSSIYSDKAKKLRLFLENRLAARELSIGTFYFKKKNYRAALKRFLRVIKDYPGSEVTDSALFHGAKSYIEIGERERGDEMLASLVDRYPYSSYTDRARRLLQNGG